MGGYSSEQRRDVDITQRGTMVKHQVLSYGLLLNRWEYQDEFLKKVILVTSLNTLNHAITDTVLGKEESLGLQTFFSFLRLLQPSWKIMETQIPQNTVSHKAHPVMDKTYCTQLLYLKDLWFTGKWSRFSETSCEIFQAWCTDQQIINSEMRHGKFT